MNNESRAAFEKAHNEIVDENMDISTELAFDRWDEAWQACEAWKDAEIGRFKKQFEGLLSDLAHDRGQVSEVFAEVIVQRDSADAQCARLRMTLHEIAEEWAGAECGEFVHAQEAYAIGLCKRMWKLAAEALRGG